MARPRKPTEQLRQQGAFVHNPNRAREDAATAGPLGDPPATLPRKMHKTWRELAELAPIDVLTCADRPMFELLVSLQYTYRQFLQGKGKWSGKNFSVLVSLYTRCGMTPSDRSKVHAAKKDKPSDPAAAYFTH